MDRKIVTISMCPPIPISDFNYQAVREGWDLGELIGYGATRQEAIDDLLAKEDEV